MYGEINFGRSRLQRSSQLETRFVKAFYAEQHCQFLQFPDLLCQATVSHTDSALKMTVASSDWASILDALDEIFNPKCNDGFSTF